MTQQELTPKLIAEMAETLAVPQKLMEDLATVTLPLQDQLNAIMLYGGIEAQFGGRKENRPTPRQILLFAKEFLSEADQRPERIADRALGAIQELHAAHCKVEKKALVRDTILKALTLKAAGELVGADAEISALDLAKQRIGDEIVINKTNIETLWKHTPLASATGPSVPLGTEVAPDATAPASGSNALAAADPGTASASDLSIVEESGAPASKGTELAKAEDYAGTLSPVQKIKVEAGLGITVEAVTALATHDWSGVEETVQGMVDQLTRMRGEGCDVRALVRLADAGTFTPANMVRVHEAGHKLDLFIPELANPEDYSDEGFQDAAGDYNAVPLEVAQRFMDFFSLDDEGTGLEENELTQAINDYREVIIRACNDDRLALDVRGKLAKKVDGGFEVREAAAMEALISAGEALEIRVLGELIAHPRFLETLGGGADDEAGASDAESRAVSES